jgi:hypothetical protein
MRLSLESCHTRRRDDPNIRWAQAVTASGPLAEQKVRGLSIRLAEELPGAPQQFRQRAMLMAMRRASSSVSTLACSASFSVARL